MKKLLFIITLLFVGLFYACTAMAQDKTEPITGLRYIEYSNCIECPLIIYFAGYQEDVKNSEFVRKFVPANKDKFTIIVPYASGWEAPMSDKRFRGLVFAQGIKALYPRTFNVATGFSLGGGYGLNAALADEFDVIVICAGSGSGEQVVKAFGAKPVKVRHYHATGDPQIPISSGKYRYTWLRGKLDENFIEVTGNYHSAAPAYAYSSAELVKWILSYYKPDNSGMDYPIKKAYLSTSKNKLVIEFENGTVWEYPPPPN